MLLFHLSKLSVTICVVTERYIIKLLNVLINVLLVNQWYRVFSGCIVAYNSIIYLLGIESRVLFKTSSSPLCALKAITFCFHYPWLLVLLSQCFSHSTLPAGCLPLVSSSRSFYCSSTFWSPSFLRQRSVYSTCCLTIN